MNVVEISKLKFRRQYLITPEPIQCPFQNVKHKINSRYELYAHIDLKVTEHVNGALKIILLGDIFDYEQPEKGNRSILEDLNKEDFCKFLEATSKYSGRYVLIYVHNDHIHFVTDATTTRKVFYYEKGEYLWLASQPLLLATLLGLKKTEDPSRLSYYGSRAFYKLNNSNIGNMTIYDHVYQLTANRYLDVSLKSQHRFWPNKRLKYRPVEDIAEQSAAIIKGTMESITNRYEVMIPITAGKDSRLLLAGTKDIKEKIFYYLNQNKNLHEKHHDITIPRKILGELNLEFHLLALPEKIDDDFARTYYENNQLATRRFLPHIYNYYLYYQDKVNLPANFASQPWGLNALHDNNVTAKSLANLYGVGEFDFAIDYYREWLDEVQELCRDFNISPVTLFYWEESTGNRQTQIQMDKDIAQEEVNPLNSRLLNEVILSVPRKYNIGPDRIIFKKIVEVLWPELHMFPINPSAKKSIQRILDKVGLLNLIYWLKYPSARK